MIESNLFLFEQAFSRIAEGFAEVPGVGEAVASGPSRDLSDTLATSRPALDDLTESLRDVCESISAGASISFAGLVALRNVCRNFLHLYSELDQRVEALRNTGHGVEGWEDYRTRLDRIAQLLTPIAQHLDSAEFRLAPGVQKPRKAAPEGYCLPDPQFEMVEGPAPLDLPRPGTWTRVKAQFVHERLPDPPFMTDEMPAPSDLPYLGPRFRVRTRPGSVRLPDPIEIEDDEPDARADTEDDGADV